MAVIAGVDMSKFKGGDKVKGGRSGKDEPEDDAEPGVAASYGKRVSLADSFLITGCHIDTLRFIHVVLDGVHD